MNQFRHPRLSVKLGLVVLAIVAGALGIVYAAVVPRLEDRLVANRIDQLERSAPQVVQGFTQNSPFDYDTVARFFQANLGARVVVFEPLSQDTIHTVADSNPVSSQDVTNDPIARAALETGRTQTGRVDRDGPRGEVAVLLDEDTAILLSASLRDTLSSVKLVERTLLISGIIALLIAWFAGSLAALRLTHRIRRLELAAGRIAAGDFEQEIVDPVEDEVGELARAFDRMRQRLAHLDRARREFIGNASHELRTPLFSLSGFLELMADEDVDPADRKEFVEEMSAQVTRLTKLATDLLDLTRLDADQLSVEQSEVDIAESARTVCEEFSARAEASEHALSTDVNGPAVALADEQRVLQVARILVENATRHTPAGTNVVVSAGDRNGAVGLSVADDGPGVPESDQEHLFERFYRAGGGQASGSGLGLAIASELADRMGGSIEVSSKPGETVFTLLLPRADGVFTSKRSNDGS
ncbi:MAG TPA: HAMP domain-containing sensor histidine kinase [Gaiellaceae bacterium]|nr:HAMP domain-containing sensor histidine kinase [Gaiellaceae bacterium]